MNNRKRFNQRTATCLIDEAKLGTTESKCLGSVLSQEAYGRQKRCVLVAERHVNE
jgi:hypothetical protein